jgi:hypothetical protein
MQKNTLPNRARVPKKMRNTRSTIPGPLCKRVAFSGHFCKTNAYTYGRPDWAQGTFFILEGRCFKTNCDTATDWLNTSSGLQIVASPFAGSLNE